MIKKVPPLFYVIPLLTVGLSVPPISPHAPVHNPNTKIPNPHSLNKGMAQTVQDQKDPKNHVHEKTQEPRQGAHDLSEAERKKKRHEEKGEGM